MTKRSDLTAEGFRKPYGWRRLAMRLMPEQVGPMTDAGMTDREQIERADRFVADLREMIEEAIANPVSRIEQHDQCLRRIAATLDAVPFVTFCNLANLGAAWRGRMRMPFMTVIEVYLMAAGGGPTLDYADAMAFLAVFERMIDKARKRWLN